MNRKELLKILEYAEKSKVTINIVEKHYGSVHIEFENCFVSVHNDSIMCKTSVSDYKLDTNGALEIEVKSIFDMVAIHLKYIDVSVEILILNEYTRKKWQEYMKKEVKNQSKKLANALMGIDF